MPKTARVTSDVDDAKFDVVLRISGTPRRTLLCPGIRRHRTRRRTQHSHTPQDQQVPHTTPPGTTQASSRFVLRQATGHLCKSNVIKFLCPEVLEDKERCRASCHRRFASSQDQARRCPSCCRISPRNCSTQSPIPGSSSSRLPVTFNVRMLFSTIHAAMCDGSNDAAG